MRPSWFFSHKPIAAPAAAISQAANLSKCHTEQSWVEPDHDGPEEPE
jgi:hypothetical protein